MPNDAGALTLLCAESLDETQENTPKQLIYGRLRILRFNLAVYRAVSRVVLEQHL